MNISGNYKTQHGELVLAQHGDNITATYQENGVCSGKLSGNKVEGIWKNKKDQGLFEWTFDGKGNFAGKYKSGIEKGPMRGKWDGKAINSTDAENNADTLVKDKVEIILSGRIPKYYFGRLKESFQDEFQEVLLMADESIETEQDFLKLLLGTTLEDKESERENFTELIPLEELEEKCPNFYSLYQEILDYDLDHFGLYDALFDTAEYWAGGNGFITFFEDDCSFQLLINGKEVIKNSNFGDFSKSVKSYHTEEAPVDEFEKNISKSLRAFIQQNSNEFGLPDDLGVGINKEGIMFCESWFTPPSFEEICDRDFSVTILHDDIIEYTYFLEVENFDLTKLLFLAHANYGDFRGNSLTTIANYLFYDNEIVLPDENWHRDKGIELEYESRDINLDFFLNG